MRSLLCGHSFCATCLHEYVAATSRPTCPECREKIKRGDERRIYLNISYVPRAATVISGLAEMDANAKLVSVAKAGKKIEQATKDLRCDQDLAEALLRAVEDFKDRIAPAFAELDAKRREIQKMTKDHALAQQVAATRHREKTTEYEESMSSLRSDNAVLEERNSSLEANDARQKRTIEALGTSMKAKDTQIVQYRQTITEQKNRIHRYKARIEELKTQKTAEQPVVLSNEIDLDDAIGPHSPHRSLTSDCVQQDSDTGDFEGMPGPLFSSEQVPQGLKRKRAEERSSKPLRAVNGNFGKLFATGPKRGGEPSRFETPAVLTAVGMCCPSVSRVNDDPSVHDV
ncbi:uncharacterized protein EV420DRAFT_1635979 [Desarmillaria tabescens]|uniref:RING-type domain-containing protein n=1 Tax=Armillaria tabescens TaxID=1929756 RepID=A0AA39NJS5_ARMTA|nr:uncharacterized protein EV420DRAFT_1635979 [Desarmillaria tabescens]KAK0466942.1 hypothetical protein EV420DRAFT_1635979 [Desarmillaria tabescens]